MKLRISWSKFAFLEEDRFYYKYSGRRTLRILVGFGYSTLCKVSFLYGDSDIRGDWIDDKSWIYCVNGGI